MIKMDKITKLRQRARRLMPDVHTHTYMAFILQEECGRYMVRAHVAETGRGLRLFEVENEWAKFDDAKNHLNRILEQYPLASEGCLVQIDAPCGWDTEEEGVPT